MEGMLLYIRTTCTNSCQLQVLVYHLLSPMNVTYINILSVIQNCGLLHPICDYQAQYNNNLEIVCCMKTNVYTI